jgi:two-component system sensor histidine kinase UhpB
MDLRRTLVLRLGLAFAALLAVFVWVWFNDLQEDTLAEQAAATRLVDLLLTSQSHPAPSAIAEQLASGPLRHVRVQLLPANAAEPEVAAASPRWFALPTLQAPARRIPLGDQVLVITPDPHSEWREQWIASSQVIGMLVLFGAISLGMTWWAVHRALHPVRDIEIALERIEAGESATRLPAMALREFQAIAHKVEHLSDALTQARQQQQALTHELMQVQDKERRELAAELHDEFGQSLTAINATATFIERHAASADASTLAECAREIGQESRRITGHVRQMLAQLRPYGLNDGGMREALQEIVNGWQARLPQMVFASHIDTLPPLPAEAGLALYRCLQEALTNCVRHSQARRVQVACSAQGDAIALVVADDGCGRASQVQQRAGNGLLGLRERLRQCGGQLLLQDAPEGGLVLSAFIPLPQKDTP